MNEILIAVKEPGKYVEFRTIEDDLPNLQQIVGGWLEAIQFNKSDLQLWCNEEGKLIGLEPNFKFFDDIIVGTVFFTRTNEYGENVNLTENDILFLKCFFEIDAIFKSKGL